MWWLSLWWKKIDSFSNIKQRQFRDSHFPSFALAQEMTERQFFLNARAIGAGVAGHPQVWESPLPLSVSLAPPYPSERGTCLLLYPVGHVNRSRWRRHQCLSLLFSYFISSLSMAMLISRVAYKAAKFDYAYTATRTGTTSKWR